MRNWLSDWGLFVVFVIFMVLFAGGIYKIQVDDNERYAKRFNECYAETHNAYFCEEYAKNWRIRLP